MSRYNVELTCSGTLTAHIGVEADSEAEAKELALKTAKEGDVVWHYEGVDDNTIECGACTEIR